jgi:hypothetical protein
MKRILTGSLTALFAGAVSLAAAPAALHAASHPGSHPGGHRAGAPSGQYYSSVIYPRGRTIAHGSMATLPDVNGLKLKFYTGYLKPGEIYQENVVTGACGGKGRLVVQLGRNQADPDGSINAVTTVNPTLLSSSSTLHVDVLQDMPGAPTVACGEIHQASVVLHLHAVKTSAVGNGGGVVLITYNVSGNEVLYKTPNRTGTDVVVFAQGLEPSTLHEEHIHNGQCIPDQNGQVRYDLYYMETDPNGEGVAGTFFEGRINVANSYGQVHAANLQSAACANFGGDGLPMQGS